MPGLDHAPVRRLRGDLVMLGMHRCARTEPLRRMNDDSGCGNQTITLGCCLQCEIFAAIDVDRGAGHLAVVVGQQRDDRFRAFEIRRNVTERNVAAVCAIIVSTGTPVWLDIAFM